MVQWYADMVEYAALVCAHPLGQHRLLSLLGWGVYSTYSVSEGGGGVPRPGFILWWIHRIYVYHHENRSSLDLLLFLAEGRERSERSCLA